MPESYANAYKDSIQDSKRRTFAGMLSAVDEGIGNVTAALKARGMLENTLFVFTSDNGGPILGGDAVGARNWPLRGGKHSIWEGGVRATAFVSGFGLRKTGREYQGLMHGADWLPTLGEVAGYDLQGTLPLDGVSQWAALSGKTPATPRTEVVLGNSTNLCSWQDENDPRRARYLDEDINAQQKGCGFAIRSQQWKLLQGYGGAPDRACNTSSAGDQVSCRAQSGTGTATCPDGWCLYDVTSDPYEENEISGDSPDVLASLKTRMGAILRGYTQYELDRSCAPHKFVNTSLPVWAPWC